MTALFHKGTDEPSKRVVVPFKGEGGLRSLREDRDAEDEDAFTSRPSP